MALVREWQCEACGFIGAPDEGDWMDDYIDSTDQATVAVELECPNCLKVQVVPASQAESAGWVIPR